MYIVIHTFAIMVWVFGMYFAMKAKTFKRQVVATTGVTTFIALADTIACAYYEAFVIQNQMKWLGLVDVFGWSKFVSVNDVLKATPATEYAELVKQIKLADLDQIEDTTLRTIAKHVEDIETPGLFK